MIYMAKLFKRLLVVVLTLIFSIQFLSAYSEPDFGIYSESIIVYNLTRDITVYQKNSKERIAPASLTKMVTALVILNEEPDLAKKIKVESGMLYSLSSLSIMHAKVNDVYTIEQLLYGLMLPSGADAAQILAISNAKSESAFVEKMNALVRKLELTDTNFKNASGKDAKGQYSTASDMLVVLKEAYKQPVLKKIMTANVYNFAKSANHPDGLSIRSTLSLKLKGHKFYTPYLVGGKTGYTDDAGSCLASFGVIGEDVYLVVSLKAQKKGSYYYASADAQSIYAWLDKKFYSVKYASKDQAINTIVVNGSDIKELKIVIPNDLWVLLEKPDTVDNVAAQIKLVKDKAPIEKGEVIAVVQLKYQDRLLMKFEAVAQEDVKMNLLGYLDYYLTNYWSIILVFLISAIALLLAMLLRRIKLSKRSTSV